MDSETFKALQVFAKVAAPAGLAIGVMLLVFKDVLLRVIFKSPSQAEGARIIRRMIYAVWSVSLAGIAAWAYVTVQLHAQSEPAKTTAPLLSSLPYGGWMLGGIFEAESGRPKNANLDVANAREIQSDSTAVVLKSRPIKLIDYRNQANANWKTKPTVRLNGLLAQDDTGVVVQKGERLTVREKVSYRDGDRLIVWVRVAAATV